jgi:hypothetical protein
VVGIHIVDDKMEVGSKMRGQGEAPRRALVYAVKCPIQNCQILALMYAQFSGVSVHIRSDLPFYHLRPNY